MTNSKPYTGITLLLLLAISLYSCDQTPGKKETVKDPDSTAVPAVRQLKLNMPKDEETEIKVSKPEAALTMILVDDERWYCYTGTNLKIGQYYIPKTFRDLLLKNKNKWGDSLIVIIKPSDHATYAGTVDALDEMTINSIKRYAIIKLTKEEEKHFNVSSGPKELPQEPLISGVEKISIEPPTEISSAVNINKGLIIRLTKEGKIRYKTQGVDSNYQFISDKKSNELKEAIARYKSKYPAGRIFISASGDARYPDFSLITDALKANNELKYQLIASEN